MAFKDALNDPTWASSTAGRAATAATTGSASAATQPIHVWPTSTSAASAKTPSSSALIVLNVADNQISGRILPSLINLAALMHLDLRNNRISGELPADLGKLKMLSRALLGRNQISSMIPSMAAGMADKYKQPNFTKTTVSRGSCLFVLFQASCELAVVFPPRGCSALLILERRRSRGRKCRRCTRILPFLTSSSSFFLYPSTPIHNKIRPTNSKSSSR